MTDETNISRRDVLAGLAAAPAALLLPQEGLDRAAEYAQAALLSEEQPQGTQARPYEPKNFSTDEWRLVRSLVNYVIPRDARSGSATDAGVPRVHRFHPRRVPQ